MTIQLTKSGLELYNHFTNTGQIELAEKVAEVDRAMTKWTQNVNKLCGVVCPTCRNKFHEPEQIDFIENMGECGTCDHVRGDL